MLKDGRPCTVEGEGVDDALITRHCYNEIAVVGEWIRGNKRKSRQVCSHTSYFLKHKLEEETGLYLTNNEFKDAMCLAGYKPVNADAVNWLFYCTYLPDMVVNESDFYQWVMKHSGGGDTKSDAFYRSMCADSAFPVFSDHDIILMYLESVGAYEEAIAAFEDVWKTYITAKANRIGLKG